MRFLCALAVISCVYACSHNGKTYEDGEEWSERNAFKMQCKKSPNGNWRVIVSGCITPDGLEVPINSTKSAGQYDWECNMTPTGQISLKQAISKTADCAGGHPTGSEWTDKSFRFKCDEGGKTTFVGCIATDGSIIADGETKDIGGFDVECKKNADGTVTMGAKVKSDGSCRDSAGVNHKAGETWVESEHFVKICKNGFPVVEGCKIPDLDDPVPLNGKATKGNMEYFCEGSEGAYRFYSKVKAA